MKAFGWVIALFVLAASIAGCQLVEDTRSPDAGDAARADAP